MTEPRPRRTVEDLHSTPEGMLRFPSAEVLATSGGDEGEGTGFDRLDPSAVLETYVRVPAPWKQVLDWYDENLLGLGWHPTGSAEPRDTLDWRQYVRGQDHEFWIRLVKPSSTNYAPKGAFDWPGTVYSTVYKVRPARPEDRVGRADSIEDRE